MIKAMNEKSKSSRKNNSRKQEEENVYAFRICQAAVGRITTKLLNRLATRPTNAEMFRNTVEAIAAYMADSAHTPGEQIIDTELYELITQEIDRSEQRSIRARERARQRKAARLEATHDTLQPASPVSAHTTVPTPTTAGTTDKSARTDNRDAIHADGNLNAASVDSTLPAQPAPSTQPKEIKPDTQTPRVINFTSRPWRPRYPFQTPGTDY